MTDPLSPVGTAPPAPDPHLSAGGVNASPIQTVDLTQGNGTMQAQIDTNTRPSLDVGIRAKITALTTKMDALFEKLSTSAPARFLDKMQTAIGNYLVKGISWAHEKTIGTDTKADRFISNVNNYMDNIGNKFSNGAGKIIPSLQQDNTPSEVSESEISRKEVDALPDSDAKAALLQAFEGVSPAFKARENAKTNYTLVQQQFEAKTPGITADHVTKAKEALDSAEKEFWAANDTVNTAWSKLAEKHPDQISKPK